MDDNLITVLTAVPLSDPAAARQWFQLLCDAYGDQPPATWDDYVAALAERAPAEGVDPALARDFGAYVAAAVPDPLTRVGELTEYGDTLPDWYFATLAIPDEPAATHDEAAWHAFLAENGPRWAGTEDTYQPWRDWFAHTATEQGLGDPATALLTWLDTQPDRIAALAAYGVVIAVPAEPIEVLDRVSDQLAELDRLLAAREADRA